MIAILAVLKAQPGKTQALREALSALLRPTREEPGNLEYALFQRRDEPETLYMHERWRDEAALDHHVSQALFQAFVGQMDPLLAEPLRLEYLTPIEA